MKDGVKATCLATCNTPDEVNYLVVLCFFFKQKTAYEMLRSLVGSEMCIRDRSRLFHAALGMSPRVIFMGAGNIGIAPAFFPPVSWMYTERAREVRELSILQCRKNGVEYVDLF